MSITNKERDKATNSKTKKQGNLSDDGFLTLQTAIPADQLIPGLCRH